MHCKHGLPEVETSWWAELDDLVPVHNNLYEHTTGSNAEAAVLLWHNLQGGNREKDLDSFARFCSTSFEIIILLAAEPRCDNCFVIL